MPWLNPSQMIRTLSLFLISFLLLNSGVRSQQMVVSTATSVITPQLLQEYIGYLASDSMKGRNTPSPGLDSAAVYIAGHFKSSGLKPLNGSYYQDLDFCYFNLAEGSALTLTGADGVKEFTLKNDFVPYDMTGNGSLAAQVVFAGYGITAPQFNYDDYQGIEVKGKIVLILRQEPGQTDSTRKEFGGKDLTKYAGLAEKQKRAAELGAAGILVVSGPLNYTSMRPRGFPWPSLSKTIPHDVLPLHRCTEDPAKIPMVQVGEKVIVALFGSTDSLRRIQQLIETTMKPHSFTVGNKTMDLKVGLTKTPLGGRNVIGYLEGSDPELKKEAIVIGAHYDHVGFIESAKPDTDYIYNGADDNASGTSGVIALAKAFAAMPEKPKRSVIFMAYAGEEKGLLGSATYVGNPLWPLKETMAMLNLDMISRNHPDSLEIIGARQNPDLAKIIRKQNKKIGFILEESKGKSMGGGSDHYNFYKKEIPDIFFFAGLHKDYHQVGDNPDKIDAGKAARVSRLAFLTAWYLANDKKHYKLISGKGDDDE